MRKQVRVVVFDQKRYDGDDWPPDDAADYMEWFIKKLNTIPLEYRKRTQISLSSSRGDEDSHYARIIISYYRPEVAGDIAAREAEEQRRREVWKDQELQLLAELKAKYES